MVPETLFTLPMTTGAVIVGPLIIGAAILALIGVGAMWLSSGNKRSKRLATTGQAEVEQGESDPLDDLSTEDLRLQAGEMLVAADNAVQESEQELLFASASYGEQKVATFQQDLEEAKEHLRESFRLQQQVDSGEDADERQARDLYARIIRGAQKVDETLQSHQEEFDGLRNLERDPAPALEQLRERLEDLNTRRNQREEALNDLAEQYDDEALAQYRDNLTQAAEALQAAESARQEAAESVDSGDSAEAVLAIHSGEQGAADTQRLVESMEQTAERLDTARKNLDVGISQTEQDIAQAKATYEAGQAPELAGPIAAAEQAVSQARQELAAEGRINPLELLQSLELAHRELDAPLNSVRDRQAKDRRAREMLDTEMLTARNQVESSIDFLRSRRYGVSTTARTRMAEAERCLTEAQTIADSQPSRAVELAQQAKSLAVQATQIAQRESAEVGMRSMGSSGPGPMGGGFGRGYRRPGFGRRRYGTGGGFGGFATGMMVGTMMNSGGSGRSGGSTRSRGSGSRSRGRVASSGGFGGSRGGGRRSGGRRGGRRR